MNMPNLDRDYPFQVELPPPDDLSRLVRMKEFCAAVDYRMRTEGAKYRWCFPNRHLAEWFQVEFGGELFDLSDAP